MLNSPLFDPAAEQYVSLASLYHASPAPPDGHRWHMRESRRMSRRVYVDSPLVPGGLVELPGEAASHLVKVLRARSGDDLILFCGDGREYAGTIETVRGSRVTAAVGGGAAIDRESPLLITLVQCVPRGDRMDLIVQKATELGVTRIVPVLSRRSVVRLDANQAQSKTAHWRAIAVNACEQCGRNRLPAIAAPMPLLAYLGEPSAAGAKLVLQPGSESAAQMPILEYPGRSPAAGAKLALQPGSESAAQMPILEYLGRSPAAGAKLVLQPDSESGAQMPILEYLGRSSAAGAKPVLQPDSESAAPPPFDPVAAVEIAIGPEGGFAEDELEALRIAAFERVKLGPRTLRTETAAIAALAWLQSRFGDMDPTSG